MSPRTDDEYLVALRTRLEAEGVIPAALELKSYPDEVNVLVHVPPLEFSRAVQLADLIEQDFQIEGSAPRYLIVRRAEHAETAQAPSSVTGVDDERVTQFLRLISAKSRVSSAEPSLVYVPDARASIATVTSARHHLIFGRRGAGKSALLMEARKQVVAEGASISWTNIQTLRLETPQRVFLYVLDDVIASIIAARRTIPARSGLALALSEIHEQIRLLLHGNETSLHDAQRLVPRCQRALSQYLSVDGNAVYAFMDDFYYVPRDTQPQILDMLHGAIRDANIWLKIASIRHLTNWWQASPPTGLQSGQDADLIDLDVTLQDPALASRFLGDILAEYARQVEIGSLSRVFNKSALDRLVLASGAVPRDYMVLATSAIGRARTRAKARLVGVQDVNQAAGDAASAKVQELEEDMAANSGEAERTLGTLDLLRRFCLEEKSYTYFLVGFRDKEANPKAYSRLTDLMDTRLIHLVNPGVSDPNQAGSRFEAYMLDLSQFSGSRLKQKINVLDFEDGHFLSRRTRTTNPPEIGRTSLQLIGILRRAPEFEMARMAGST